MALPVSPLDYPFMWRRIVKRIEKGYWIKTVILPLIAVLPPSVLAGASFNRELTEWLAGSPYLVILLILWPGVTVLASICYNNSKPPRTLKNTELHNLLKTLANIVGKKVERFGAAAAAENNQSATKVFRTITRPDLQLEEIVAGIYKYFEVTRSPDVSMHELKLRVALAWMGDSPHILRFDGFCPLDEKPRSRAADLQNDQSGFSRTKASGKILVVPSILREYHVGAGRSFIVTDNCRRDEEGSMICYPIKLPGSNEIPYVVSICSAIPDYFRREDSNLYVTILKHFEQRIVLEYFLKRIKEKQQRGAHANTTNAAGRASETTA